MIFDAEYLWELIRDFIPESEKEEVARNFLKFLADELDQWDVISEWGSLFEDSNLENEEENVF